MHRSFASGLSAKLWVFGIGLYECLTGQISWQFLILVSADLVFALLFIRALAQLRRQDHNG